MAVLLRLIYDNMTTPPASALSSAPALEEKNCDPLSVTITSKLNRRFYRPGLVSMGPLPPTDSASSTTL